MSSNVSILMSLPVLAVSSTAHGSEFRNGGEMTAGTPQFETWNMARDNVAHVFDEIEAAKVAITGRTEFVIEGGSSTAELPDYTREIALRRGRSTSFDSKESSAQPFGRPDAIYNLNTAAEIKRIFARVNRARVEKTLSAASVNHVPPEQLTAASVLTAPQAADATPDARQQIAEQRANVERKLKINESPSISDRPNTT